jgi:uncharacterized protein YqjF (DUF2071 family)
MTWTDLLFIHWPVPVEALRPLVPPPLEIDRHEGRAWIGLIPFSMPLVRPWWIPAPLACPGVTAFHECNVRTYVRRGEERGVWFLSLDASSRAAVWAARRFWHLAYHHARILIERRGATVHYRLRRSSKSATMSCRWELGEALPPALPGSLPHFLSERYTLYCARGGQVLRGPIQHEPWRLRQATLRALEDALVAASGVAVTGSPVVFAGDPLHVRAWPLEPMA